MTALFERVLLPVADSDDAAATCDALAAHEIGRVVALHVVEKAGGAVDKASVEQREEYADEIFAVVEDRLADAVTVDTRIAYGTDVAETIFDVADDVDATSIVITPRGGSRWIRLLTGDVALSLVTESDRPVVVLPDDGDATALEGSDVIGGSNPDDETDSAATNGDESGEGGT